MLDDYGNEIKAGDTLSICVGMPGREVLAKVVLRRGRLYACNKAEGDITVRNAIKWYPVEVVKQTAA